MIGLLDFVGNESLMQLKITKTIKPIGMALMHTVFKKEDFMEGVFGHRHLDPTISVCTPCTFVKNPR